MPYKLFGSDVTGVTGVVKDSPPGGVTVPGIILPESGMMLPEIGMMLPVPGIIFPPVGTVPFGVEEIVPFGVLLGGFPLLLLLFGCAVDPMPFGVAVPFLLLEFFCPGKLLLITGKIFPDSGIVFPDPGIVFPDPGIMLPPVEVVPLV